MNTKKPLAVLLCAALALTLAACGAKTDPEPLPTATPEVTATPEPTAEPKQAQFVEFLNQYCSEKTDDSVTEDNLRKDYEADPDSDSVVSFYTWLSEQGYTYLMAEADQDGDTENGIEPCEDELLAGFMNWLDAKTAAQIEADNAETETSSAKGDGLGGVETISGIQFTLDSDGGGVDPSGIYYDPDNIAYIRKAAEGQAERDAADKARSEEMQKNGEKLHEAFNDKQAISDFRHELGLD